MICVTYIESTDNRSSMNLDRMFVDSCKRLRIMKGSEAIGLGNHRFSINPMLSIGCVQKLDYYEITNIVLVLCIASSAEGSGEVQEEGLKSLRK